MSPGLLPRALLLPLFFCAPAARAPAGGGPAAAGAPGTARTELLASFVPATKLALDGRWLAYLREEALHGDLNGDGDAQDRVLTARDLSLGVEAGLGLAVPPTSEGQHSFLLEGDVLLALVSEPAQGGLDRNGDGDALDGVLAAVDLATGSVTNLGLAGSAPDFELRGGLAVLLVPELAQGADLDGSGTLAQAVPHAWRAADGLLTNLGVAAFTAGVAGGRVWYEASELAGDRNGDGDQADRVLAVWDPASGTSVSTGLATYSAGTFSPPARPVASGTLVAQLAGEAQQGGADLDGDGDALDHVLFVHELATGTTTNVGLAVPSPAALATPRAAGTRVLFLVSEAAQGGLDRNGDGDALDEVAHLYDAEAGTVLETGLQASALALAGPWAVLLVREDAQGALDRNGDGDVLDHVLAVYDARTGATLVVPHAAQGGESVLGLPANPPVAAGDLVLFAVVEAADGGTDHNGDGDLADRVAFVLEPELARLTPLGLATALLERALDTDGRRAFVVVSEAAQGGLDHNGDGDAQDGVAFAWQPGTGGRNLRLAVLESQVESPFALSSGAMATLLEAGPSLGLLAFTRFLGRAPR